MPPRTRSRLSLPLPSLAFAALLAAATASPEVEAQQPPPGQRLRLVDSATAQVIRLRDGSTLVGEIVALTADSLRFRTTLAELSLSRAAVRDYREVRRSALRAGEYWPASPNATRLLFAPTGRMLEPGKGYFADHYLFLVGANRGITERFSLGAGASVLPTTDFFRNNIFYVTPKVGLVAGERVNVAAGVLAGFAGLTEDLNDFGIAYGVATFGGADRHLTVGGGYGFANGDWANEPVLIVGGETRLSRRSALVSENYYIPGLEGPLVSYGIRLFGEKLSVDLAFFNLLAGRMVFPGVPYVDFVVAF